jgi:phosphoglycolate phosphatase
MHPARGLQAVVFDLDGTLIDTADDFIPAVQQLLQECGRAALPAERIRASVSNGSRALVSLALQIGDTHPQFERHRARLLELYAAINGRHARLYPGLEDLLQKLEARGLGWGIATNKPRLYADALLEKLDIRAPVLVCPEDVTHTKPDPECLHIAARALRCECRNMIYVGDHARDVEAGRRAGCFTIAAAYGYLEPGDSAESWEADALARHSGELDACVFGEQQGECA